MYGQSGMAMSQHTGTPGHSSPESFEVDDDLSNPTASGNWQSAHSQQSPGGTPSSSAQQPRHNIPQQKRRRVTRACDECRRKKIKCDGKQPCTHCTVYSYDCTYDQPSNRRRNPAPQYIEALENRLQRAEALLRTVLPAIDLNDPNLDSLIQQRQISAGSEKAEALRLSTASENGNVDSEQDAQLRSMIESTGQLDLDERGQWDFHGGSSGAVFLRRMREQFGGLLGGDNKQPFLPRPPRPVGPIFGSPRSAADSPLESGLPNTLELPTKEVARTLCDNALTCACALLCFVHGPSFYEMFDRVYDTPPENFGDEENRFLPLLYVVLALGSMFTVSEEDGNLDTEKASYLKYIDQGAKYFKASRQMLDITDCRDITSLQAICFMILFLQSSANLSTCYSYIGVALRSALRMGLHRNLAFDFNPIERETRRRIFWVIRKMDTYVSALLGFPRMLGDEDIDQLLPSEIDDAYITKDAILPWPEGKFSTFAASNAHTRLMTILAKVIKYIYPIKGVEESVRGPSGPSYTISHTKIREIELDLTEWLDKLPMQLRPGGEAPEHVLRVRQLLRLAYGHVQMMLYRPFLHYVSKKANVSKCIDERSYACAAAGVSVSRNIVHITAELQRQRLLVGAYWFTMYTTFFAILSLVFFVLENPDKPGSKEILADATAGREALKALARRSMAADRCSAGLDGLFAQLPEKLKRTRTDPGTSKKRRSAPISYPAGSDEVQSSPDLSAIKKEFKPHSASIQRATTFPTPLNTNPPTRTNTSFDSPRFQATSISDSNLRQNYHEFISPTEMSATGTPDSSSTVNSLQNQYNYNLPYGGSNVQDLGAMMFPSADPFAYPAQPLLDFENNRIEPKDNFNTMLSSNMFLSNSGANNGVPSPYDNLVVEGQLFGPLPPYLMQNPSSMLDMNQIDLSGLAPPNSNLGLSRPSAPGFTPVASLNFDEIFAGTNDEWNNMLAESGLGLKTGNKWE